MTLTNFPQGISSFGVPLVGSGAIPVGGPTYFVSSLIGSDGNEGTYDAPLATTARAVALINQSSPTSYGGVIAWMPGHAETITAAGGVTISKTGVQGIGLGTGSLRPTFTFTTATTASFLLSAANVSVKNIIGVAGVNSLANPFDITASGVSLDIEWHDATYEAVSTIRAVSASNLKLNLRQLGLTGGSLCVNPIKLTACNEVEINLDFNGKASTAIVNFVTTASTGVRVSGYVYNSGTTTGAKNVVDTITGSTWFVNVMDGAAGFPYIGGSASAPVLDSSVAVATALYGVYSSAAQTVSRTGNVFQRLADLIDQEEKCAVTGTAAGLILGTTALFVVAGGPIIIKNIFGLCTLANNTNASTLKFTMAATTGGAVDMSAASATLASAVAGTMLTITGTFINATAINVPPIVLEGSQAGVVTSAVGTIQAIVGTAAVTGSWIFGISYAPLVPGATVTASF
jgi:hypothetical protein